MLQAACVQERAWQAMGFGQVHLAVPLLSRRQLAWSGLARRIRDCLHAERLEPRCLEIELCEDVLMSESAAGLRALKEQGVRIALDGFGRGPTSLRCLQPGVLDTLKLAREWHHETAAAGTAGHAALVGAIIGLARELGLRVVAEAVDDPAQLAFLRQRGCSAVQGLMGGAPLPAQACTSWLRKAARRRLPASTECSPGLGATGSGQAALPAGR
jgi:EAL domain-containing protein (putative c-di-GMP-specific phosphodiesterase class I)